MCTYACDTSHTHTLIHIHIYKCVDVTVTTVCESCVKLLLLDNLGLRHFPREKVLGPAKPLWYVKGSGFTMDAGLVYQLA